MDKKNTIYIILGVIAIFNLLLLSIPASADSNGLLRIESDPTGADVYVKYGIDAGKYLGNTPFYYDPALNGGVTYMKFVKPGYRDAIGIVFKYMSTLEFTVIYLNPLEKPVPTLEPTPAPTPEPTPVPTPVPTPARMLRIESNPSGADAYVKYGPDAGKYIGTTPFYYDPTLNGGVTYMKLSKPGYRDATGVVFKYMTRLEYTIIYLNPN